MTKLTIVLITCIAALASNRTERHACNLLLDILLISINDKKTPETQCNTCIGLTLIMVQIQGQVVEAKPNLWKINSIEPIAMMMCNAIERNKNTANFQHQVHASVTWKLATNNSPNAAKRPNAKDNLLAVIQRDFSAGVKDICVIIRRTYWNRISALRATETEN